MKTKQTTIGIALSSGLFVLFACQNSPTSVPEQAPSNLSSYLENGVSSQEIPYSSQEVLSSMALPLSSMDGWVDYSSVSATSLGLPSSSSFGYSSFTLPASSGLIYSSSALPPSSAVLASSASAGTGGKLQVTFQSITNNGEFCPSNVNAAWVTTGAGVWMENLEVRAKTRASKLAKWKADYNKAVVTGVDGVAGATQGGFYAKSLSWDVVGKTPGNYTLKLEYSCDNFAGPFSSVNFALNGVKIDTTVSFSYFKNVHLYYVP